MYNFPKGFYTDVRLEEVFETTVSFLKTELRTCRERKYNSAFIRLFDGNRWFYSSTTDVENVQNEMERLASLAEANKEIDNHPNIRKMKVNVGENRIYTTSEVSKINISKKVDLLKRYFHLF